MPRLLSALLLTVIAATFGFADETSFHRVKVFGPKGKQIAAVLTFSDTDKAIEVRPAKGNAVSIPYSELDKCSYEFTKKHRIKAGAIVFVFVSMPAGAVVMLTKSRSHWLEIDYHQGDGPQQAFVLRMDKREYIHVLDAVKSHTGIEAEVLGNANKR